MSWAVLATLLAAAAGCGEPKIDADEARAIFRATVKESSPDPARYLDRKMEPRFRCEGNRGVWIAGTYGPSGSFDDSELVVIDAASGRADHVTAPCVAPLALTADRAQRIAERFAADHPIRWADFYEPFLQAHCRTGEAPYWLYSAMNRSLQPDSMLLIRIDDATGVASLVPQG